MPPVVFCGQGVAPCAQKQPPFAVFLPARQPDGVSVWRCGGVGRATAEKLSAFAKWRTFWARVLPHALWRHKRRKKLLLVSLSVSPRVIRTNKKGFCVGKSLFCASCAFTLGDFVCLSRQVSKVISAQCVFVGRVLPRAAVGNTNLNRLRNRRQQTQTTTKDNKNAFQADSVNVSRKCIRRYRQTN